MKLICTKCGTEGDIGCECGVAFIALANSTAKAMQVAAALADPASARKSARVIAKELGVGAETVNRVRKATAPNEAVEKRVGKDGKARKSPKLKPALKVVPRVNLSALDIGTERIGTGMGAQPVQLMPAQIQRLRDCKMRVETTAARVDVFAKFDGALFEEDVRKMLAHTRGKHEDDRDFARDARKALALIEGQLETAIAALAKLREIVTGRDAA